VRDENGDVLADSHIILNRWKNYFCQLLNVCGINDVRQTEMHETELLVTEPISFKVEIAILERYKLPDIDQMPVELIQAVGNNIMFLRSAYLLILFGIRKNCHSNGRNLLLCLLIRRVLKLNVVVIQEYHSHQRHTEFHTIFLSHV